MSGSLKIDTIGFQTLTKDIIGDIYLKQGIKKRQENHILKLKLYKGQGDIRKVIQNKIDSIGQ